MREQPVGVQPSGCPDVASARITPVGQAPPASSVAQPHPARNQPQIAKLPARRTLRLLNPCPQTLGKHRYLICKSSYSYSRPPISKSRITPSSVPTHPPRATFSAISGSSHLSP